MNHINDSKIRALMAEAAEHGDLEQVKICRRALNGSARARLICATIVAEAQKWADDGKD